MYTSYYGFIAVRIRIRLFIFCMGIVDWLEIENSQPENALNYWKRK